jgi:hypothetical protein
MIVIPFLMGLAKVLPGFTILIMEAVGTSAMWTYFNEITRR